MDKINREKVIAFKAMLEGQYSVKYITLDEALAIRHLNLESKIAYKEEAFDVNYLAFIAKISKSRGFSSENTGKYDYIIAYINPENNSLLYTIVGDHTSVVDMSDKFFRNYNKMHSAIK